MKKIILLLLAVLSTSLFSQSPKYWEKIDFQFDSGIKFIHFNSSINYYDTKFFIVTDSNFVYLFDSVYATPIKITPKIPNFNIKDGIVLNSHDTIAIYLISDDKQLYYSLDSGQSWTQIFSEIDGCKVNCITTIGFPDIVFGTESNGVYIYDFTTKNYINVTKGLNNKNIKLSSNGEHRIFMTENNFIYDLSPYQEFQFDLMDSLDKSINIKYLEINNGKDYFLDDSNRLYLHNNHVEVLDTFGVTCFCTFICWEVGYLKDYDSIDRAFNSPFFGTMHHGVISRGYMTYEYLSVGTELNDEEIRDIKLNHQGCPDICLVGSAKGNLYKANLKYPTGGGVNDGNYNNLKAIVIPQPASTKAKLSFTLPENSRVTIKLFNALGMEMTSIADGIFNEGENTVPIDVSGLVDGIYFVAIELNGGRIVEKVIVNR